MSTRQFVSQVFGPTRDATDEERAGIEKACADTPVAVLQGLNKVIRARGLVITIRSADEVN